jgi:hypothetical protein
MAGENDEGKVQPVAPAKAGASGREGTMANLDDDAVAPHVFGHTLIWAGSGFAARGSNWAK